MGQGQMNVDYMLFKIPKQHYILTEYSPNKII